MSVAVRSLWHRITLRKEALPDHGRDRHRAELDNHPAHSGGPLQALPELLLLAGRVWGFSGAEKELRDGDDEG